MDEEEVGDEDEACRAVACDQAALHARGGACLSGVASACLGHTVSAVQGEHDHSNTGDSQRTTLNATFSAGLRDAYLRCRSCTPKHAVSGWYVMDDGIPEAR